jgi:hypothetical protein
MAAHTCGVAQHATLSGTTADSITFTGSGSSLAIQNQHATNLLYFRLDGTTAVGAADDTYSVQAGQTLILSGSRFGGSMSLSVVGNANPYAVMIF